MTKTMTKPKVKQAKIDVEENLIPKLRFKITNTKAQYFPDPLTQTDYFGWQVGDLLCSSYNTTAIFEVVEISRDLLTAVELASLESRLYNKSKQSDGTIIKLPKDKLACDLFEKYKNCGNFGVCTVKLKTVMRGATISQRNNFKTIKELAFVKSVNYNGFVRADLDAMIQRRTNVVNKVAAQANRLVARRDSALKQIQAIETVKNKYYPPVASPIVLMDDNLVITDELKPEMLL